MKKVILASLLALISVGAHANAVKSIANGEYVCESGDTFKTNGSVLTFNGKEYPVKSASSQPLEHGGIYNSVMYGVKDESALMIVHVEDPEMDDAYHFSFSIKSEGYATSCQKLK